MTHDEQLAWERRAGRPAAAAAIASALIGIAALVVANASVRGQSTDDAEGIVLAHKNPDAIPIAGVMSAISVLLVAPALLYLFRATKYRRDELPDQARYLALAGPALFAAGLVGQAFALRDAVNRTFEKYPLAPKAANKAAKDAFTTDSVATWALVLLGLGLVVGAAIVLISLHARRAGLLSSFMGVTGIIVGVLVIVPFVGRPPIVYFFWAAALGLLFLDRWPGQRGRGPAWESGEAEPWPTAAELRAEETGARAAGSARRRMEREEPDDDADYDEAADGDEELEDEDAAPAATPHPRSKKRKRKRRR